MTHKRPVRSKANTRPRDPSSERRLTARFVGALVFAAQLHNNQKRKGTNEPYVGHLLGVASIVLQYGGDEDQVIAALLHDAVEDQGGRPTLARIRRKFGRRVADIVEGCTDAFDEPKPAWRGRKVAYLASLRHASADVRLVCAADKLQNARSILADYRLLGERLWRRFTGRKQGTLWYYQEVVRALSEAGRTPLVGELERVVGKIRKLAAT